MDNRRVLLIESFKDTMRLVREREDLAQRTKKAMAGTRLFMPGFKALDPEIKSMNRPVEVIEDTTFHAARQLLEKSAAGAAAAEYFGEVRKESGKGEGRPAPDRVAVLNFANAYSPGGGVTRGAMAQEECLCRSSNLYSALTIPYLIRNYYKDNTRTTGDMGTDKVIWTPRVTVFKSDDTVPVMLDRPFEVDVLTSAAPYYDKNKKHPVPLEQLRDVFYHRILNVLEAAAANDVDCLVLGAFGCGAFNNPPALVAEVFRQILIEKEYRNYFRRIVFAIKKNDRDNSNLQAFRAVLVDSDERFTGIVKERFCEET